MAKTPLICGPPKHLGPPVATSLYQSHFPHVCVMVMITPLHLPAVIHHNATNDLYLLRCNRQKDKHENNCARRGDRQSDNKQVANG